ncbi:RidA family protein [Micromonospora sp. NPDC047187]|uniref:RidA family protein n=1 Tax=Micromonospora sp. NPDC047187 TaxID=3155262 RepID=UPI0033FA6B7F
MAVSFVNPEGLPATDLYHHVAVATGAKQVFIAGQVAVDADGGTVGAGDLAAQVEQCYLNVAKALAGVGGSFGDVVRLTAYIVDWTPDKMTPLIDGITRAAAKLEVTPVPPFTGLGVSALAGPDYLVEVEATAVMD